MKKVREKHLPPLPDTWPDPRRGFATERVFPVAPDTEDDVRVRLGMFAHRAPEVHQTARKLVEHLGLPKHCPRPACARAKKCASRYVVCFIEQRAAVQFVLDKHFGGSGEE